jgi:outer membrane protein W
MMRLSTLVVGSCLVATLASGASAQTPFKAGENYIGPSISLSTYGSTAAFEGNFEHAINDKWGWGVSVGYFSYHDSESDGFTSVDEKSTVIPIAGTVAYHFDAHNDKLDPFVGGSIGYFIFSSSCSATSGGAQLDCGSSSAQSSTLLIGAYGGIRYWVNPKLALTARAGYGIGFLTVGVDFKI